jgi:cytochrome c biogenesis protein CcdA/thiol-disulfide isomerase/thioredoxin
MILLIFFAFVAGLVTILSPCILPVLPIVLASSVNHGKKRPLGIVTGFIASFTFFTLTLSAIVKTTGIPADGLRGIAVLVVALFGLAMLIPAVQIQMEKLLSHIAGLAPKSSENSGFVGGIFVGLSLGLIWAPCVGPILASVITIAATSSVNFAAFIITLAYSIGTAIPMFAITYGGRSLLNRVPWLMQNSRTIQKTFGVFMILTAAAIYFNVDRTFQTYILEKFPNYGVGLTKFEDNQAVKRALEKLTEKPVDTTNVGKPMNDITDSTVGGAPDFIPGGVWFNTSTGSAQPPLTMKQLRGKVVLVDFWTYTCINCIRTLPYIKAWNEKYKDKGLVIVGVHTPEFAFEKEVKNVAKAIKDFGITYPVMQDNNYATWNAYGNHYWPAHYLIDKNGKIRDTHFGEGAYDETERFIQKLLQETGATITEKPDNIVQPINAGSPESYLGFERIEFFSSPESIRKDAQAIYSVPENIPFNTFAYGGSWMVGSDRAMPKKGATLIFHFNASEVFLVMRPTAGSGEVQVSLDGAVVGTDTQGADVKQGTVVVESDRLYKLIRLDKPGEHILKLEFLDNNLELYAFTFG